QQRERGRPDRPGAGCPGRLQPQCRGYAVGEDGRPGRFGAAGIHEHPPRVRQPYGCAEDEYSEGDAALREGPDQPLRRPSAWVQAGGSETANALSMPSCCRALSRSNRVLSSSISPAGLNVQIDIAATDRIFPLGWWPKTGSTRVPNRVLEVMTLSSSARHSSSATSRSGTALRTRRIISAK